MRLLDQTFNHGHYCESIYQKHRSAGNAVGSRKINEIEKHIYEVFREFEVTYGFLPATNDRIEVADNFFVVVELRQYIMEVNGSKMLFYQIREFNA